MSVTRFLAIATLSTLVLFSCTKEEITPVTPAPTVPAPEVENFDTTIDGDVISNARQQTTIPKYKLARAEITACGTSFHVDIRIGQLPAPGSYSYEIRNSETNELVESGSIEHSNYTNSVLQPCTEYSFKFFGINQMPSYSVTQIISSDGCGGNFSC